MTYVPPAGDAEDIDPYTVLEDIRAVCAAPPAPPEEMMTPEESWAALAEAEQYGVWLVQQTKADIVAATKRRDFRAVAKESRYLAGLYGLQGVMKILRRGMIKGQTRLSLEQDAGVSGE